VPVDAQSLVVMADALVDRHDRWLWGSEARDATAMAAAAIRLRPDAWWTHATAGRVAQARRRHRSAEQHYRAALSRDPTVASVHHGLGLALAAQGLRREAVHALGEASRLDPTDPWPYRQARFASRVQVGMAAVTAWVLLRLTMVASGWLDPVLVALAATVVIVAVARPWVRRLQWRRRGEALPVASRELVRTVRADAYGRDRDEERRRLLVMRLALAFVVAVLLLVVVSALAAS
jgi:tetratricopeptide (TPR) repeat protein